MPDVDVIETELEDKGEDQGQEQEPQQQLPERAMGEEASTREALLAEAMQEGVEEGILTELAEKPGELTVEDLRRLPGADQFSDEELMAQWQEATKQVSGGQQTQAGSGGEEFKLPFPIYDDKGNKVESVDKLTVQDLLSGKVQIGYTALGKEQRKALNDVIRNASLGHFNEQKYNTVLSERQQVAQKLAEAEKQLEQSRTERQAWDAALSALAMGNVEPMRRLAQAYVNALQNIPAATPGMVPVSQVQQEQETIQRGMEVATQVIEPKVQELAKAYGANANEIREAIKFFVTREAQFFTAEKLQQILEYEIPMLLEQNGYKANSGSVQQPSTSSQGTGEIEELKKTVAALQSQIANQSNAKTAAARTKAKSTPPVGSGSTPGAGDSQPSFRSRAQMQAWLRGDPEWSKA